MKVLLLLFTSIFAMTACRSFQAVDSGELDRSQLVGIWHGVNQRAELEIYCSGAFSYKIPNKLNFGRTSSTGSVINRVNDSSFDVGPIWNTNFKVQTWPYRKNGHLYMVVEGVEYHRTQSIQCR